jgi:succinyl-CoA synthetase beta subunit
MRLHEYQAKKIFLEHGIAVPKSVLISRVSEAEDAMKTVGFPCVIKSQVLSGGRGKAGLISIVKDPVAGRKEIRRLFDHKQPIKRLLVEEAIAIEEEIYLSITIDPVAAVGLVIASKEGGIDIETLAQTDPKRLIKEPFDIRLGLARHQANDIAYFLSDDPVIAKQLINVIMTLQTIFSTYDAELVEINPLFVTKEKVVVAGDAKLTIDDNSTRRQKDYEEENDALLEAEKKAKEEGIPFIRFDGDIGLMCAGAGLTTTVYDLIHYEGGTVANYLEFGGPNYKKAVQAMEICLSVPSKVILVVTFGTIARADVMAQGIIEAIEKLKPKRKIITCIRGTNEQAAIDMLEAAGLKPILDTEEAVRLAVRYAKEVKR